jgi:UDP-N-acetylglucosamine 2-epimerase (non-hydrolysing)
MENQVLLSMGTRPEIIKMAPVWRALREAGVAAEILHTGQHDTMAWPLYEFFGMAPDHVLQLERGGNSLSHLSAALLTQSQRVLEDVKPRAVLVHGDTQSAAMVALAAFHNQIPIGHVEAGLRSGNLHDPFPEELNRQSIGRLARWHFAPTPLAVGNLKAENISPDAIEMVGNTIVDATQWVMSHLDALPDQGAATLPPALDDLPRQLDGRRLAVVTAHRRENWGAGIARIGSAVVDLLSRHPELVVVWPVHGNPAVRDAVQLALQALPEADRGRLFLCEPLDYAALMVLMRRAWLLLTDSGGLQEEALSARVPVLVLRDTTERPEVLAAGAGLLVGTQPDRIVQAFEQLWSDAASHRAMSTSVNPFGDGHAARRIAHTLQHSMPSSRVPWADASMSCRTAAMTSRGAPTWTGA